MFHMSEEQKRQKEALALKKTKGDLDEISRRLNEFQKKLQALKRANELSNEAKAIDREFIDALYTKALEDAQKIANALNDPKTFQTKAGIENLERLLVRATEDFVARERHHDVQIQRVNKQQVKGKEPKVSGWENFKFDVERAKITVKRGFLDLIRPIIAVLKRLPDLFVLSLMGEKAPSKKLDEREGKSIGSKAQQQPNPEVVIKPKGAEQGHYIGPTPLNLKNNLEQGAKNLESLLSERNEELSKSNTKLQEMDAKKQHAQKKTKPKLQVEKPEKGAMLPKMDFKGVNAELKEKRSEKKKH